MRLGIFSYLFIFALYCVVLHLINYNQINRDGILYLTQASYFLNDKYSEAAKIYNWPFYSFLIALLSKLTNLPLIISSYFINIFSSIILFFYYLKTLTLLSENKSIIFFGSFVFFCSIPVMDNYLTMIIRDHGMWAMFFMSVYYFLCWQKNFDFKFILISQLAIVAGFLFKPELILYIFVISFFYLLNLIFTKEDKNKQKIITQLLFLPFLIIFFCLLWFFSFDELSGDYIFSKIFDLVKKPLLFFENLNSPIKIADDDRYLLGLAEDYILSFKIIFFSYIALSKWIFGFSIFNLYFAFISLKRKILIKKNYVYILTLFFLTSFLVTFFHLLATNILSSRFLIPNWLICYLFSALGLQYLWNENKDKVYLKLKVFKLFLISFFIISQIIIIMEKSGNNFGNSVSEWIIDQEISTEKIYFNDRRLAYYSGIFPYEFSKIDYLVHEYLIIDLKSHFSEASLKSYQAAKYIPDYNNPKVIIYKRSY